MHLCCQHGWGAFRDKAGKVNKIRASVIGFGALLLSTALPLTTVQAGGLGVREQSTYFLGTAFAGNGAGGALSSSFWNSAAIGEAGQGINTESSYSLILGRTEFTILPGTTLGGVGTTEDQNRPAVLASSYAAYRLNNRTVVGVAINAPFGLSNEVDNSNWSGQLHHRSGALFTLNVNPMVSYKITSGLHLGVGFQAQYAKLKFKNAAAVNGPTATLEGDDIGLGFTAGLLWKPNAQTSIGLGYRSAVSQNIEGDQRILGVPGINDFSLKMDTPDMVTFSIRHALTTRTRLLGTVEWTNWSKLQVHPVQLTNLGNVTIANFDFQYSDGWFFSVGSEYDYSDRLTLRAGLAYEISPVDDPSKRLPQVPDADRIWLSTGLSYKISDTMTLDLAYTHIFIDDSTLDREPAALAAAGVQLVAGVESAVDIIAVGWKMKWGGHTSLK